MAKVIQGSPDSRVRRNGESPVVKASVEMEEQMVNLEGRSVTRSSDRIAKSLTDSSGPGGTRPRPVSMAGIEAESTNETTRKLETIFIQVCEDIVAASKGGLSSPTHIGLFQRSF